MAQTSLEIAVLHADAATIHLLLDNDEDEVLSEEVHGRILHFAFKSLENYQVPTHSWLDIFLFLIAKGARATGLPAYPLIPMPVSYHGSARVLRILFQLGFQLRTSYHDWETHELHAAIMNPSFDAFYYLVKHHNQSVDAQNYLLQTPLHIASKQLLYDKIKFLVELGADPDCQSYQGSPLLLVMQQHVEPQHKCFRYLLRVSQRNTILKALHQALLNSSIYVVPLIQQLAVIHQFIVYDPFLLRFSLSHTVIEPENLQCVNKCADEIKELGSIKVLLNFSYHDLFLKLYEEDYSILAFMQLRCSS